LPAVMNAANESCVAAFISGGIGFMDIPAVVSLVMEAHKDRGDDSLEAVFEADAWARQKAEYFLRRRRK
ncbi:MAG: 1-deoxy-D-xylulose-5-phosphate reductoisomerase, partial [Candidatus Omnitrophota bacterium]